MNLTYWLQDLTSEFFQTTSGTSKRRRTRSQTIEVAPALVAVEHLEERVVATAHPLSDLPILHSNPGAPFRLYLDFTGHTQNDTGRSKYQNVTTPVFNHELSAGSRNVITPIDTFSDDDLKHIKEIWRRVAEDYDPFNVDVTTQDPGNYEIGSMLRVVVGGSYDDWFHEPAAGVALVPGNFVNDAPNIAWVFSNDIDNAYGRNTPKADQQIADSISHEAGHSFGLEHQRDINAPLDKAHPNSPSNYTSNNNDPNVAPIMGDHSYAKFSGWWIGQNPAGERQDDMSILASVLGYRYSGQFVFADGRESNFTSVKAYSENGEWRFVALDTSGNVSQYDPRAGWTVRASNVQSFSVAPDLSIYYLQTNGTLWRAASPSQSNWTPIPVAGQWMIGDKSCGINQQGNVLTFVNEGGASASGTFLNARQVQVPSWGNLVGTFQADGTLQWSNGTVWTRTPRLAGQWLIGGKGCSISQQGTNLTVVNENGAAATGRFLNAQQIQIPGWGNLVGTLQADGSIQWNNGSAWSRMPQLAGQWLVGSKGASITQQGASLTFTNENGSTVSGTFLNATQVKIPAWGNLVGTLQSNGSIQWGNGTSWFKMPQLAGQWLIGGKGASITQQGANLTLTNENGSTVSGTFLNATQVQVPAWGNLVGTLQSDGSIKWGNGTAWFKMPQVGGQWVIGGKSASIIQQGATLTFINENGSTASGTFLNANQVQVPAWGNLVGTLQADGSIQWSNGSNWAKLPQLAGQWSVGTKTASITQQGASLTFTNENGSSASGIFLTGGLVQVPAWGNLIGTLTDDGAIRWNNGTTWIRK